MASSRFDDNDRDDDSPRRRNRDRDEDRPRRSSRSRDEYDDDRNGSRTRPQAKKLSVLGLLALIGGFFALFLSFLATHWPSVERLGDEARGVLGENVSFLKE